MKLHNKVNIVFVAIQIVLIFIVTAFVYHASSNLVQTEINKKSIELKNRVSNSISDKINKMLIDAKVITDMIKNSYEPEEALKQAKERFPFYSTLIVTDKDGLVIDISPFNDKFYKISISNENYWRTVKETNDVYLSSFGETLFGYNGISVSHPITFDYGLGEIGFTGVLTAYINDEMLFSELSKPTIGDYGITIITDNDGNMLSKLKTPDAFAEYPIKASILNKMF